MFSPISRILAYSILLVALGSSFQFVFVGTVKQCTLRSGSISGYRQSQADRPLNLQLSNNLGLICRNSQRCSSVIHHLRIPAQNEGALTRLGVYCCPVPLRYICVGSCSLVLCHFIFWLKALCSANSRLFTVARQSRAGNLEAI